MKKKKEQPVFNCDTCPYKSFIKCPYELRARTKIMIIGEAPGEEEIKHKPAKPFIGASGRLLFGTLAKVSNLQRKDVSIINSLQCMGDNKNVREFNLALKCCRENITTAIKKVKPKVIVAFGSNALKQVLGNGQKILSKSGNFFWSEEFNCWVLASVHPSYALRNGVTLSKLDNSSTASRLWVNTFRSLNQFIKNGFIPKKVDTSDYQELTSQEDKDEILNSKIVAIDYETNGLNMFDPKVKLISLSFTVKPGKSRVILNIEKEKAFIKEVLTNPDIVKIVANRPFEELFTLTKLGFDIAKPVYDVLTMAHIINEDNCQTYSLEQVAEVYANMPHIKDVAEGQRDTLEDANKDLIIRYNGVDTDATYRAYISLAKEFKKEPELKRYFLKVINPAQNMYAEISKRGMKMNMSNIVNLEKELREKADELSEKAIGLLPQSIKERYAETNRLRLSIPSLVIDYLFLDKDGLRFKPKEVTEKTGAPSTSEKHIKQFANKSKFVRHYLQWKKANKLLTTYFKMIYGAINSTDNKIYPNTLFIATKTGRLVVKNPSLQVIPQRGEFAEYIKNIFTAPKGWYLFERDLGQSELRIMGWLSNSKNILKALHNGIDLHKQTASLMFGIPVDKVTKQQRQSSKSINFGFLYGAYPKTFQQVAKNDYGVDFTLTEATKLREKYFKVYPEVLQFHTKTINFARKYGYVKSPLGRRRHLFNINSTDFFLKSEAERQGVNAVIQSFSSDLNLISQIMLERYLRKEGLLNEMYTLFLIHDAMFGLVREDKVGLAQQLTKLAMEEWSKLYIKKHFGIEVGYPIASEFSYGTSWGNLEEVED